MVKLTSLPASTLVESIVAMVIISVIFAISLTILANISGKSNPQLKFKAITEVQNVINVSIRDKSFENEDWQKDGLNFKKIIQPYFNYDSLYIIEIKSFNNSGRLLVDRKELISIKQ